MDFGFTPEQDALRAQARRLLDQELPLDRILAWSADPSTLDRALWKKTAVLGWAGLTVPEAHGGLGLGAVDLIVLLEEMGKSLCPLPLASTDLAVAALVALGDDAARAAWLPGIAAGDVVATVAIAEASDVPTADGIAATATARGGDVVLDGAKLFVSDGQHADLLLVAAREGRGTSLFAVPADTPGVTASPLVVVDATKPAAEIRLAGAVVPASARLGGIGGAWPTLARLLDRQIITHAAEMVGAADAALRMAVEYAKVRQQFGSPIGRFQGVKHRCAEILCDVESARSLVYYAAWALDHAPSEAPAYASMAKAAASEALDTAGEECVQIHGAIGYTWECHAHLFYKRGRQSHVWLGAPDEHYERVMRSLAQA
ncbi:MAG: acyl-CoA/acyl-ACP dehydrogenase [Deltaproteobacteria bacterium]|nr:acyl-CoA/acyl-ACP dehydrogenase [Deltaproteobacteria bacterium]